MTCPACALATETAQGEASPSAPARAGGQEKASGTVSRKSPIDIPEVGVLNRLLDKFLDGEHLTGCERAEMLHIAQGFECKDSAMADDVATETIRARRKRLYSKLNVSGSQEIISSLLALSLHMLSRGERIDAGACGEGDRGRHRVSP